MDMQYVPGQPTDSSVLSVHFVCNYICSICSQELNLILLKMHIVYCC